MSRARPGAPLAAALVAFVLPCLAAAQQQSTERVSAEESGVAVEWYEPSTSDDTVPDGSEEQAVSDPWRKGITLGGSLSAYGFLGSKISGTGGEIGALADFRTVALYGGLSLNGSSPVIGLLMLRGFGAPLWEQDQLRIGILYPSFGSKAFFLSDPSAVLLQMAFDPVGVRVTQCNFRADARLATALWINPEDGAMDFSLGLVIEAGIVL